MSVKAVLKQTITENNVPIFEPDFQLDFGHFYPDLPVHSKIKTPSVHKLQNFVLESFVMESFGL